MMTPCTRVIEGCTVRTRISARQKRGLYLRTKKASQDIVEKTTLLYDLPWMGRVAPEIGDENVRELSLYS